MVDTSMEILAMSEPFPDKQKEGDGVAYFLGHLLEKVAQLVCTASAGLHGGAVDANTVVALVA